MDHTIISRRSISELVEAVQAKIALGWKPQGGVCVAFSPNVAGNIYFVQAMIRE